MAQNRIRGSLIRNRFTRGLNTHDEAAMVRLKHWESMGEEELVCQFSSSARPNYMV